MGRFLSDVLPVLLGIPAPGAAFRIFFADIAPVIIICGRNLLQIWL